MLNRPLRLALIAVLALVHGCGGSGSDAAAPVAATVVVGTVVPVGPNVQPISVSAGLGGTVNLAYTSVTLCVPGSVNCQTIDNVLVDSGSSGLRIMASALSAALVLPQQKDAKGDPVAECAHFLDGYTWGSVRLADFKIAGEQRAGSLPIQVIGDPNYPLVPGRCAASGNRKPKNTVSDLRANGILGLAIFPQDCGPACAQSASPGIYYTCPSTGCQPAVLPVALQLQHPVAMFASDNNGVIIDLPAVGAGGAAILNGALVFGIGTRANNAIGGATVIGVDPGTANFTTVYNGTSYDSSFVDSGSNAYFFTDPGTPVCTDPLTAGFYCPAATKNLSATIQGRNGRSASISFSLANATALVKGNPGSAALGSLGAPQVSAGSVDWGLPFFYGRKVFIAIDGASTPAGTGPYIAF
jgi:hypothetical protein